MADTVHRDLGLTDDEADRIRTLLGREPNDLELAMYAVMWSEHCSYKSSRIHLKRLPTEGGRVLVGPGENAGVIDAGDGVAVAIRIESHNHPSAIEPVQGAATGVGGILRDIFTMGARPIALLDPLYVGTLSEARNRRLLEGIVGGISSYGNSVGVPTVGGEIHVEPCFAGNPLVNVACVGVLPADRLVFGRASGVGNLALLLGATTGRDGIGGVSVLASAGLSSETETESKLPAVQVGDPFEEKRLIEACLELLDAHLVVGIQDLGGAGLTCATSETAARAGLGMDVDVRAIPLREQGMAPFEVMTSESQERMLAIVAPESVEGVRAICARWEVRATVVGHVTAPVEGGAGRLRVVDGFGGEVLADVPAASLADDAPLYDRPRAPASHRATRLASSDPGTLAPPADCSSDLVALLADPAWIYRQYDHQLFLNTVVAPGGDAALLRLAAPGVAPTGKAIAVSTDGNPGWCAVDPRAGAAATVVESACNVAVTGATPVAVVNCLNFGDPEHPEVMWQLSESIDGIADACRALDLPVVGGNVSFYNSHDGTDIDPTPVIGVLGLAESLTERPPGVRFVESADVCCLGDAPTNAGAVPSLGGSRWARRLYGMTGGVLPGIDLAAVAKVVAFVAGLGLAGGGAGSFGIEGIHDVADGGIGLALAEMAAGGGVGAVIEAAAVPGHDALFCEAPGRILICTTQGERLSAAAASAGVTCRTIGRTGGARLAIGSLVDLDVDELRIAAEGGLDPVTE